MELNANHPYRAMLKSELARAAGVSMNTFRRWLRDEAPALRAAGVRPSDRLLNPTAVRHLCERFTITLD